MGTRGPTKRSDGGEQIALHVSTSSAAAAPCSGNRHAVDRQRSAQPVEQLGSSVHGSTPT